MMEAIPRDQFAWEPLHERCLIRQTHTKGEPPVPSLRQIASLFARFGNLTFGGGSATIAVLHRELIERRQWLPEEQFEMSFALSRLTPGTNLLALCTSVGWLLRKLGGAVIALMAASIPCALIVVAVTVAFSKWQSDPFAQSAIHGAIAAAVSITVHTCWTLAKPHYKTGARLRVTFIAIAAFLLHVAIGLSAVQVLLLAAIAGFLLPGEQA